MADIVNLRSIRKQAKRQQDEKAAAANRAAHGIPKHERQAGESRRSKAERDLEQHRIQKGDG
jgi:hypothetical protein